MLNFRQQILRQSTNLKLKYSPLKGVLLLKGPRGTFFYRLNLKLGYNPKEQKLWLSPKKKSFKSGFGLYQTLLSQTCLGVTLGYRRQLNLVGIGYQALVEKEGGSTFLILKLGFSHPVKILIPNFLLVTCPKPRIILVSGINPQKVNNFAALLRDLKLPNPYKEKGLYYKGEILKLKQGKKT